jgi:hypothetical protein
MSRRRRVGAPGAIYLLFVLTVFGAQIPEAIRRSCASCWALRAAWHAFR